MTCVYLRRNVRVRLATQGKFNLRPLETTCRSVWPGLNDFFLWSHKRTCFQRCSRWRRWHVPLLWLLIQAWLEGFDRHCAATELLDLGKTTVCIRMISDNKVSTTSLYYNELILRWFLSIALRIPTSHDFRVISARKWALARTQRKKFPWPKAQS